MGTTPRAAGRRRRVAVGTAYVVVWLGLGLVAAVVVFLQSSRVVTVASHDAVLEPDLSGYAVVRTGPVLPDLRIDSGAPIGVEIRLGKTDAESTEALVERYGFIASQPDGPQNKIETALADMAYDAAIRGAILGLVPILVWALVGPGRRRQLARRVGGRYGLMAALILVLMAVGLWGPWRPAAETMQDETEWVTLSDFLGPTISVPEAARGVEVSGDLTTTQTRRLIESAVDTYGRSQQFYAAAEEAAADLVLRIPEDGETVVALVSDRHDNVGMDQVAREIADSAGATAVFDAGDDTSTGRPWEAFSLDSLTATFEDIDDRWAVVGNHDNGPFVGTYLDELGWSVLDGEVVDGPAGSRLLGVGDPRSSGLGTWRDETGLSFEEVGARLADAACAADEDGDRVDTVLVHDANLGDEALARGCVDLVVGGHLHVQEGPTSVLGDNGETGHTFTTGTTGGAAYAIAIGSKIRRPAQVTLLTYDEAGSPVGLQSVLLQTNGRFDVDDYFELTY
ncbi:MAG: metallophosphoesterase [Nocardioides sp.]